ncbi:hypothetical protein NM688_g2791 [Phlebia brevispora]|uniref:Uncharacterized protein n=1 Tax=Phlebia brevispora TaxID=194682 RepID=A0ACC1T7H1_9APHY|nr:hypothetical protein NM688_g2791 [Phlebia brevispora]
MSLRHARDEKRQWTGHPPSGRLGMNASGVPCTGGTTPDGMICASYRVVECSEAMLPVARHEATRRFAGWSVDCRHSKEDASSEWSSPLLGMREAATCHLPGTVGLVKTRTEVDNQSHSWSNHLLTDLLTRYWRTAAPLHGIWTSAIGSVYASTTMILLGRGSVIGNFLALDQAQTMAIRSGLCELRTCAIYYGLIAFDVCCGGLSTAPPYRTRSSRYHKNRSCTL